MKYMFYSEIKCFYTYGLCCWLKYNFQIGTAMTYEDLIQMAKELEKLNSKFDNVKIDDDMSDECRQDWIE